MTTPYEHILCPVDFSDISRAALRWSADFAREQGARLTALHTLDTTLANVGNLVAVPDGAPELRERAGVTFEEWRASMDLTGVEILVEEGPPAERILALAEERGVDLLVMGTHGLSGLQKLLLGSVTEKVLHRARVPVLAMAPKNESGGSFEAPSTILLAVDFGPESQAVVRHGVWLAEHFGAKLVVAHAVPIPYVVLNDRTMERLTAEQLESLKDTLTQDRREELRALLPASTGVATEVSATVGSPFEALTERIEEVKADLVITGAGGHSKGGLGWLGSTCHKLVRAASCPVLIVR